MDKEQLKQLLKENLSISLEWNYRHYYDGSAVEVTVKFDDEEICSDYIRVK